MVGTCRLGKYYMLSLLSLSVDPGSVCLAAMFSALLGVSGSGLPSFDWVVSNLLMLTFGCNPCSKRFL